MIEKLHFQLSRRAQLSLLAWIVLTLFGSLYFISDSEFWPIAVARDFGSLRVGHPVLLYKPLFHAFLRLPYFLPLTSVAHIYLAKMIFAGIGAASFLMIFRITERQAGTRSALVMAVLLLLSQVYVTQFFRVRSDVLSLFFSLIIIWRILQLIEKPQWLRRDHFGLCCLSVATLATTPKAIFELFVVAAFCFGLLRANNVPIRKSIVYLLLWFGLGPFVLFSLAASVLNFVGIDLTAAMAQAARYFIDGYSTPKIGLSASDTQFVWRSLHLDLLMWVCAFGAWVHLLRQPKKSAFLKGLVWAAPIAALAMFLHNQRLPFFWAALWPFLMWPVSSVVGAWPPAGVRQMILLALIVFNIGFTFRSQYWWASNLKQMQIISRLELFLNDLPEPTVFDGQGLLPRSKMILGFYSPGDYQGNQLTNANLDRANPNMVIYLQRCFMGEPGLSRVLDQKYQSVGGGVWLKNSIANGFRFSDSEYIGKWFSFEPPSQFPN